MTKTKLALACQGGGSHTAFTAGVLKKLFQEGVDEQYDVIGLSGTSGGGLCATSCWYGLLKKAQGSSEPVYKWMIDLWEGNSAQSMWEWLFNFGAIETIDLQESGLMPSFASSPYDTKWLLRLWMAIAPRKEFLDFKQLLEQYINFDEFDFLVTDSSPRLFLGAVDVLSGEFKAFDSHKREITVEAVMASAAIPNIFEAVRIGPGAYWDGLFSQNPPVSEFLVENVEDRPDEIWVIEINPKTRDEVPKKARDILDRRNELAGNLSLFQEIRFIQLVNKWVEQGHFTEEFRQQVKPIKIRWIEMSKSLSDSLDYSSKLNRAPEFMQKLMVDGEKQADKFLKNLTLPTLVD